MKINVTIGDNGFTAVLNLLDAAGNAVKPFSTPVWSNDPASPNAIVLTPASDGMSCVGNGYTSAGDFTVHAKCEGSSTPGGDPIDETLEIVVSAAEDDASETNSNITATNNPPTPTARKR